MPGCPPLLADSPGPGQRDSTPNRYESRRTRLACCRSLREGGPAKDTREGRCLPGHDHGDDEHNEDQPGPGPLQPVPTVNDGNPPLRAHPQRRATLAQHRTTGHAAERCDTRSHALSSPLIGGSTRCRRCDSGQCPGPVPALACVASNGWVRSPGESPRTPRSDRGSQARGRPKG